MRAIELENSEVDESVEPPGGGMDSPVCPYSRCIRPGAARRNAALTSPCGRFPHVETIRAPRRHRQLDDVQLQPPGDTPLRRLNGIFVLVLAISAPGLPAWGQFGFALDPLGASPGSRAGGFGYSGFGYSALGPRGPGYYVGLPDPTASNGPTAAFSPIFNSMAAAPRDSVQLGPTYGGYEYSASRFGASRQTRQATSTPNPAFTNGYGPPLEQNSGTGAGYRSAYAPPRSSSPGFTYGYGEPPAPPRRLFDRIFGGR